MFRFGKSAFVAFLIVFLLVACSKKEETPLEKAVKSAMSQGGQATLLVEKGLKGQFKNLDKGVKSEEELPAVWKAVLGNEEDALVKAMEGAGVGYIALPMDGPKNLEMAGSLSEAFLHSGDFRNFYPVYTDDSVVVMGLSAAPFRLSDTDLVTALTYARKKILGDASLPSLHAGFDKELPFTTTLDLRVADSTGFNKTIGTIRGTAKSLKGALEEAAGKLKAQYSKDGSGRETAEPLETYLQGSRLIMNIYKESGPFLLNEKNFRSRVALGLDGFIIKAAPGDKTTVFLPPDRNRLFKVDSLPNLLDAGCRSVKLEKGCWKAEGAKLERFRSLDAVERQPGGEVIRLFRGVEYVAPESVGRAETEKGFKDGAEWLLSIFDPNTKMFKYEYYATEDRVKEGSYNLIRHGLATLTLIQAFELYKEERFLNAARLAVEYILDLMEYDGKIGYFSHKKYDRQYKLGGAGVIVQCMCEYYRFERRPEWEKPMKALGEFMMIMQEDNGHYRSYYNKPGEKRDDSEVTIYPGEASLALVRLYNVFKDDRYLKTVEKAFGYYSKWFDNKKSDKGKGDLGPFVPWEMSAMFEYWEVVKRDDVADYAYRMADWLIDNWFIFGPKETYWKDFVGGYHGGKGKDDLPIWNSGVYGEGVASVFNLANMKGDKDKLEKYRKNTWLTIRYIRQIQYRAGSTYYLPVEAKAIGAIPSDHNKDDCRLDYAYHCLTVNYRALRFFSPEDWKALGVQP